MSELEKEYFASQARAEAEWRRRILRKAGLDAEVNRPLTDAEAAVFWGEYEMTDRAMRCLRWAGIRSPEEALRVGVRGFMRFPECGKATAEEIGRVIGGWSQPVSEDPLHGQIMRDRVEALERRVAALERKLEGVAPTQFVAQTAPLNNHSVPERPVAAPESRGLPGLRAGDRPEGF